MTPDGTVVADGVVHTLPLAVFDAVPVVLAAVAYLWAARRLTSGATARRAALVGAVLVTAGGAAKVAWKITIAATGRDVTWLDDLLFPLLAPGLLALAGALSPRASTRRAVFGAAVVTVLALALTVAGGPDVATVLLLVVMTAATVWVAVALTRAARERDVGAAVPLVWFTVAVAFLLAGLARLEQTIALQWVEETTNAAAQGALLLAIALLVRRADVVGSPADPRPVPVPTHRPNPLEAPRVPRP